MTLDEHDRLIAYVLGLSHALNIAFFTALAGSGEAAPRLAQLSSTTYDAQVDVATRVAGESPELYFEIQHLNQYGRESLQALRGAVELIWQSVTTGDARQFAEMMQRGREYLAGRARPFDSETEAFAALTRGEIVAGDTLERYVPQPAFFAVGAGEPRFDEPARITFGENGRKTAAAGQMMVIDRGITLGHLKWTLETFLKAFFERDDIVLRLSARRAGVYRGPRLLWRHHDPAAPAVLVVFADHAGCPWLRPLRRGFRHCFVVLRAGSVWVNCYQAMDPAVPFGGYKMSGYGRESGKQQRPAGVCGQRLDAARRHDAVDAG